MDFTKSIMQINLQTYTVAVWVCALCAVRIHYVRRVRVPSVQQSRTFSRYYAGCSATLHHLLFLFIHWLCSCDRRYGCARPWTSAVAAALAISRRHVVVPHTWDMCCETLAKLKTKYKIVFWCAARTVDMILSVRIRIKWKKTGDSNAVPCLPCTIREMCISSWWRKIHRFGHLCTINTNWRLFRMQIFLFAFRIERRAEHQNETQA